MDLYNVAFLVAGLIGGTMALIHGALLQRLVVVRIESALVQDSAVDPEIRRLTPLLLHFSTFNWLFSGILLVLSAFWFFPEGRIVAGLFAASSFLYGAVGAFLAIRGPHPSWILLGLAALLALYGASGAP